MTIPNEPYLILSSDRVALGVRVNAERAAELLDKYSPTSIHPAWKPGGNLYIAPPARFHRSPFNR